MNALKEPERITLADGLAALAAAGERAAVEFFDY
jgi:hypothetical protein